jgi:hypothetical protein
MAYRRQRGLPVDPPDPPKLNVVESRLFSSHGGSVVAGVRDELGGAALAAAEHPGLAAAALTLAAILDDPKHVPTQPAAARQLGAILGRCQSRCGAARSWSSSGP